MMQEKCLFCGNTVELIRVHGHYQCAHCKTNALPCCDGNNCNDLYLNESAPSNKDEKGQKDAVIHTEKK